MLSMTVVLLLCLPALSLLLWILVLPLWLWERSSKQQQRLTLLEGTDRELRQAITSLELRLANQEGSRVAQPSPSQAPAAAAAAAAATPSNASHELLAPSAPEPEGLEGAVLQHPHPSEPDRQRPDPQRQAGTPAAAAGPNSGRSKPLTPARQPTRPPAATELQPPVTTESPAPALLRSSTRSAAWPRLERLLIEHWTGIVGVLVVVAGITFLAINLALRLQPFDRFLLLLAAAALLAAPSLLAGRWPAWKALADWMRSGAGALVLFDCAASSGMPGLGLQWLDQPLPALALLSVAIGVNLALAAAASSETLAALHVILNLLPLAIVPASSFSLLLASGVTLIGQLLPRKRPWYGERLGIGLTFGLFFWNWCNVLGSAAEEPGQRTLAIGIALVVFGAGALLPLRQQAGDTGDSPLAWLVQLLNWGGLALVLLLLPQQLFVRVLGLALAALAALLLGLRARRLGWIALGRSQQLIAQSLILASMQSLDPLLPDALLLALAVLVESALFLRLAIRQSDPLLRRIGWALAAGSGGWLLLAGLEAGSSLQASSVMLIAGGASLKLERDLIDAKIPQPLPGLFSWWAALQFLVGSMVCGPGEMGGWLALGTLGTLISRSRPPLPLAQPQATATAVLLAHLITWGKLLVNLGASAGAPLPAAMVLVQLTPLLLLASTLVISGSVLPLGIHLIGGSLLLAALLLLGPIAAPLPGIAWLLLALLALELARRLPRAFAMPLLLQGILALGLGLIATTLPITLLPMNSHHGAQLVSEVLSIGVLLRWWFVAPGDGLSQLPLWQRFHPYLIELILLQAAVTLGRELVEPLSMPSWWMLLALALLSPQAGMWFDRRLQVWSVIAMWLGTAVLMLPSHAMPWLAISLAIAYVVLSHRWLRLEAAERSRAPWGLGLLDQLAAAVDRATEPLLYYPLFLAIAVVLANHFDHSLLTLLWAAEAFAIYVLSVILRDGQFRAVALMALGTCLWRLVAVDMVQADLTTRGLVFVGVGLLMLAMNAIASRFRSRFG